MTSSRTVRIAREERRGEGRRERRERGREERERGEREGCTVSREEGERKRERGREKATPVIGNLSRTDLIYRSRGESERQEDREIKRQREREVLSERIASDRSRKHPHTPSHPTPNLE